MSMKSGIGIWPRGDDLEQRRLARAVLRDQAVAVPVGQLERLVLEDDLAEQRDRELRDLDVLRVPARREHGRHHRQLLGAARRERLVLDAALRGEVGVRALLLHPLLARRLRQRLLRRRRRRDARPPRRRPPRRRRRRRRRRLASARFAAFFASRSAFFCAASAFFSSFVSFFSKSSSAPAFIPPTPTPMPLFGGRRAAAVGVISPSPPSASGRPPAWRASPSSA